MIGQSEKSACTVSKRCLWKLLPDLHTVSKIAKQLDVTRNDLMIKSYLYFFATCQRQIIQKI